jgi:hypothetical protein
VGPKLLKVGLVFTLVVVLLPPVVSGAVLLVRCVTGVARP